MTESQITVLHASERDRYELRDGDAVIGFTRYEIADSGAKWVFVHTEVSDAYAGHGLAGKLAKFALDDARAQGKRVVPRCPFIAGYIRKHPGVYDDVVDWP